MNTLASEDIQKILHEKILSPIRKLCIPFLKHKVEKILEAYIENKSINQTSIEFICASMILKNIRKPLVQYEKLIDELKYKTENKHLFEKDGELIQLYNISRLFLKFDAVPEKRKMMISRSNLKY